MRYLFLLFVFLFDIIGYGGSLNLSKISPQKEIKLSDFIPYKENFFCLPEKDMFVFGKKGGFIVFNSKGRVVKKFYAHSQGPGSLVDTLQFFSTKNCYYACGIFNIVKLDKNFNYIGDVTRGNACGDAVCWINNDETFFCLSASMGLKHLDGWGKILGINTVLKRKREKNTLASLVNSYVFFVKYPFLYAIYSGGLDLYIVDLSSLKLIKTMHLSLPENFKSVSDSKKYVNVGLNAKKAFDVLAGYGIVRACFVDDKYLYVGWKIFNTGYGFVEVYSLESGKHVYHFQLQDTEETIFVRMRFHPTKPILYDYDYIESEDGNDYGLIRVYDLEKAIKGEE